MRKLLAIGVFILLIIAGFFVYNKYMSPTRVALVNYPDFMYSKMVGALKDQCFKIEDVKQTDLQNLKKYDMVIFFGMGLKLTEDQVSQVKSIGQEGTPMYLQASTTKGLDLTYLDEDDEEKVKGYLNNGGNKNYCNLFRYIRTKIDKKSLFTVAPEEPFKIASDVLFHIDEEVAFETVSGFENYCRTKGIHKNGNKKVILFTSIPGPFNANREHLNQLIEELERRNMNVYPVSGFSGRLKYLKEIHPDLVVYMPHGRLSMGGGSAQELTDFLNELNVPVLCPLTVHQQYDEWVKDPQGMAGGLLSQSVTMPEFDGGIVPYALFAEYKDDKGLTIFKAIPNRLNKFGEIAENYLKLQDLDNSQKKLAFVYFKGPGKNALVAANMEVLPSLHHVLLRLKKEGYNLGDLPADFESFKSRIMAQGPVLGTYAKGAFDEFLKKGNPALVSVDDYNQWCSKSLPKELIQDVENRYGKAPGSYMGVYKDEQEYIAVARVQFGNIVLLPQPLPGLGDNTFELVHGAKVAPPHTYIAPYLWLQNDFHADAVFHFGTHGSLEFTPGKQIALSDYDWTDPLMGTTPHNYIYTISNIAEAMIAKRRSYAALQSHLTPPFIKAQATQNIQMLVQKSDAWSQAKGSIKQEYALSVKKMFVESGMYKDLNLDSIISQPYADEEMNKIGAYLAELENEKITAGLYTLGESYSTKLLNETSKAMFVETLAYAWAKLDHEKGQVDRDQLSDMNFIRTHYARAAEQYINRLISGVPSKQIFHQIVAKPDLDRANKFKAERALAKKDLQQRMMVYRQKKMEEAQASEQKKSESNANKPKAKAKSGHPSWIPKIGENPHHSSQEKTAKTDKAKVDVHSGATPQILQADPVEEAFSDAVFEIKNTLNSVLQKRNQLKNSPEFEMQAILNTLNGGYTSPSAGGDPVANPESVPTGKNMFSINAEQTPTKEAWKVAQKLTEDLLRDYKLKHEGQYPKKISFTLWGGSFIESEGTTIAQILYMLGVEPIWTPRGKVNDIRLIPDDELARPRIDVVVQTSGQLRDLAASRLFIINRAIDMAANAQSQHNFVKQGMADAEKYLIEKGFSPKEARQMAKFRVFGGVNGNYGTAIMGMVEKSDSWDSTKTVAQTYINNMGAVYSNEENWGGFNRGVFEAALLNTEAVVQPRQSNTWGALSLDHVYEFMGGLNLAVREVTGNDAESYFNDFRNTSNPRVQSLKEAIGVESRTTLLNARYIKEHMKGGASNAEVFAETFRNTFGWNVMKPSVIEDQLWDDLYDVYVQDQLNLKVKDFFKRENPYALQEMTAVMLETVRKGLWNASQEQINAMAQLHADLVKNYEAGCSSFVCDNAKLRSFINDQLPAGLKQAYNAEIDQVLEAPKEDAKSNVVLKKQQDEKINPQQPQEVNVKANMVVLVGVGFISILLIAFFIRKRRKK